MTTLPDLDRLHARARDELMARARAAVSKYPELRLGQALFNVAYELVPGVQRLAGTNVDPFYRDDRIDAFLDAIDLAATDAARAKMEDADG